MVEKIFARVCFVFIILLLTFVVLEVLSPYFLPKHEGPMGALWDSPGLRYPKPYVVFGGEPYHEKHDLNILGYTGTAPERKKDAHEYRIFVLGGSTVFGQITEDLEERFVRNGHGQVRVFNWGVVSSISGMELARIVFEVLDYGPDLIVLYSGGNDVMDPYCERTQPGYPFQYVLHENNPLLSKDIRPQSWALLLLFRSNIFRYLLKNYYIKEYLQRRQGGQQREWMSDEWKEAIPRTYIDNVYKAHVIAEAFDVDLVSVYQPLIFYKNTRVGEEESGVARQWDAAQEYAVAMRERIVAAAEQKLLSNGMHFVDFSKLFENNQHELFYDIIHLREEGNALLVSALYEEVQQYLQS